MRLQGIKMAIEFATRTSALRQSRGDAGQPPPRQRLANVGNADLEQWHFINSAATIHRR
jgi:hypothetical protein